jgi:aldehyde:ferredoxin oxidoreductase
MIKGWTGKRLLIDLSLQKAWSEDISQEELRQWLGGRGINASYFSQHFQSPVSPSSSENPIAFAVGPLTGTLAPCSGWTSIASFSPLSAPSRYGFTRMPGYFGVPLKGAGYDQCVLQGKADRPITLWIDDSEVKFEKADHLWGKDVTETSVTLQEEKGDRSLEVLCIGPAGERQIPFANVIHRLSWTGDHLGLGYLFGVKNLKAIAIRGKKPVTLQNPSRFLNLCLTLKDRIQKDQKIRRQTEEGMFSLLGQMGRIMMNHSNGQRVSEAEKQWVASLKTYLSGREGCFSCPINCGRNIQYQEGYFGGLSLEKAWHLGPYIGVYNGDWTLKLHHLCQTQGLDPFLTGSLLANILKGIENGPLSEEEVRQMDDIWDQGEKAFVIIQRMMSRDYHGFHFTGPSVSENEDLDVLADIISFCKIVVNRLNLMTLSNITDLIEAAMSYALSQEDLFEAVQNILQLESHLQHGRTYLSDPAPLPRLDREQMSEFKRREERKDEPVVHRTTS